MGFFFFSEILNFSSKILLGIAISLKKALIVAILLNSHHPETGPSKLHEVKKMVKIKLQTLLHGQKRINGLLK